VLGAFCRIGEVCFPIRIAKKEFQPTFGAISLEIITDSSFKSGIVGSLSGTKSKTFWRAEPDQVVSDTQHGQ
jgi:hypothetical protein